MFTHRFVFLLKASFICIWTAFIKHVSGLPVFKSQKVPFLFKLTSQLRPVWIFLKNEEIVIYAIKKQKQAVKNVTFLVFYAIINHKCPCSLSQISTLLKCTSSHNRQSFSPFHYLFKLMKKKNKNTILTSSNIPKMLSMALTNAAGSLRESFGRAKLKKSPPWIRVANGEAFGMSADLKHTFKRVKYLRVLSFFSKKKKVYVGFLRKWNIRVWSEC